MTAEDYSHAVRLKRITGETLPAGREVSQEEILARPGIRDAAIVVELYAAGLLRDEVVKLSLESCNVETGELFVTGKRNQQRKTYIANGALDALRDWLIIRGSEAGALFVEVNKGGSILVKRESMTVKPFRKVDGVDVPNQKAGPTIYRGGAMTSQASYNMLTSASRKQA